MKHRRARRILICLASLLLALTIGVILAAVLAATLTL